MEKVDYTTRFGRSNRRNIEAANRRVPSDYTPRQKIERAVKPYWEAAKKFDREKTGIAQFAGNVKDFYSARNKYSRDKGLGMFEETYKNPYSKDQLRWLGNMGYNVAEFVGDVFKTGAQALGTAATGIDFIPGDEGIGGEWSKMQGYNPKFETAFGNISNPWYDDLKAGEFEMAMGEAERATGLSDLQKKLPLEDIFGITNFQNHLRNYGLDLEGVKKEDFKQKFVDHIGDKFFGQFSDEMGTFDYDNKTWEVPQEWMDRYEGYTDEELAQSFNKDFNKLHTQEYNNIIKDYGGDVQKKYTDTLMEKFDFNEDELAYAMAKGDPNSPFFTDLHKGLWQDIWHENTMPFVGELGHYEGFKAGPDGEMIYESYPNQILPYETDEAKELSKSGWSSLPEWAMYPAAFGAVRKGSGIVSKATEGTKAGAINKLYQNIYPAMSGSGGPIPGFNFPSRSFTGRDWLLPGRSKWQFPATTYGASLRETGDE